jgi:asparagine synthase (glutamine-hydrolysing)
VGSCLSGGLDSGSIAAAVGDVLGGESGAYSALTLTNAGFEGDESRLASASASRAGLQWVPVEVDTSDVAGDLKKMIASFDQPFSTLSMFGQYAVMKRARELGLKVMLDGQGGDEVFLGYERVAQRSLVQWARSGSVVHAISEWIKLRQHASIPMTSALIANLAYARPAIVLSTSRARMTPLADRELLGTARGEIAGDIYGMNGDGVYGVQQRELLRYCLPRLLRFEDRNSMAFAVEARVPLLAKNIVSYALRLPLQWRVNDGWTKYALRRAVSDRLPREVVWNPKKRGFEVPQKRWLEAIRPWIADVLAEAPANFPIHTGALLGAIDRGEGASHHLWRATSVALWMRMNDVQY